LTDKDQRDYFRFEVSEDKTVQLELTGLTGDADMRLYEGNEAGILDKSTNRRNKNESITYEAEAGEEYFVEIFSGKGKGKADYNLKIDTVDPIDNNPQVFEGGDLNQLPKSRYRNEDEAGEVQIVKNDEDHYNFSVSEDSVVEINLTNLSDNLNLRLEKANGSLIEFEPESGKTSEKIVQSLEPGNYVAKVLTQGNADSSYQLTMKAIDIIDIDPDGGLPDSPAPLPFVQDIGVLTDEFPGQTDDIGGRKDYGRDQNDYYKFELTEGQNLSLDFSARKTVSRVQLLGADLIPLKTENLVKTVDFTESGLEAGTYYVRIQAGKGSTSYSLNLEAGGAEDFDPDGGDDKKGKKSPVDSDKVNQVVFSGGVFNAEDDIGFQQSYGPDVNDFYKFTVDAKSNFSLNLTGLSSKADVNLLDSDGIIQKQGQGSLDKTIESALTPGDYYVQVARRGANQTQYDLSMNLNSDGDGDGNNSFADADPLTGLISSDVGRTIGGKRDKSDFYEFTASSSGLASWELEVVSGKAEITLYDASKSFLGSASADEELPAFLQQGEKYFVEVSAAGSGSSFYDLSVSI
jgi:hypothetical protein